MLRQGATHLERRNRGWFKIDNRLVLSWLKNNNEECSEKQIGVEQRMNMTIPRPDFPTRPIVGAKRGHVSRERSWTPGVSSLDNALLRRIRTETHLEA